MNTPINRRRLVQGTAWAAPVVLAATSVPAYAASPARGLDGWLLNTIRCTTDTNRRRITIYEFNATGNYPDRGLWVSGTTGKSVIGTTKIIQYIGYTAATLTFQTIQASQWTTLAYDASAPKRDGYIAYSTTYKGTWSYDKATGLYFPANQPYFRTTVVTGTCLSRLHVTTRREVVIDGETYATERSATPRTF